MSRVIGHRVDPAKGRATLTMNIPSTNGQYAPEILYLGATPTTKSEYLHVVAQLQAFIESLPASAALEVDLLQPGGDPSPDGPWVSVAGARGSTPQNVATGAFDYWLGNQRYNKAAVAAGTALPAGTIPTNQWGGFCFCIDALGNITCIAMPNNFTTGYASSAAADAANNAYVPVAGCVAILKVTIQTKVGSPFVCGTDALTGGVGGNVANATNYNNVAAVTGNWLTNVAAVMNSVGLKAAVVTSAWDGVRVRGKSGGTPGAMVVDVVWT